MRAAAFSVVPPLVVAFGAANGLGCRTKPHEPIRIAAASDLKVAFGQLGPAFEAKSGRKVSFSFGSTGLLSKQVKEGAPFDVFAAANVSYVDEVVSAGACDGATKTPYARGRLAIWSPERAGFAPPSSLEDLADPRFARISIANPDHAPYGKAAKAALEKAGVWDRVHDRIVKGENVEETLELAQSGNVEAAIVAYSLVIHRSGGSFVMVDPTLHPAIDQALVVCRHGADTEGGKLFAAFLSSDAGRTIMRDNGFLLPDDASP